MVRVSIGDICDPKQWKTLPMEKLKAEGYPVYGANGIIGYFDQYNHEKEVVAVTCRGATCGNVNLCEPFSYVTGNAMCLDNVRDGIDTKYLYYAMKAVDYNRVISGSAQPQITRQTLKNVELKIVDEENQKGIVNILEKIERLKLLREKQLDKLGDLIQGRFVEMFGDVIQNNKRWRTYKLSDISTSRLGKMVDAKQQTGKYSYPYLANFNVQWFRFDLTNLNQIDFDEKDQIEFNLQDGDLMVCEGGEIGRCAVWHNELQPCFFQKAVHRVRCNFELIQPDYLAWWFKFNCDHEGFSTIAGAKATIAHLTGVKLKQLDVVVPPLNLQNQFVDFVSQVDKSKVVIQKSIDKLQLLFDSLMQQYFG